MKAIDLMKQLEQDPEYQERRRQQDLETQQKIAEIRVIEEPFIKDLHANGFDKIQSSSNLLTLKKADKMLTDLLLKWIPQISNKYNSQEMLVRGLAIAEKPFDGTLLIELFDNKNNSWSFKWAIGNTLASAQVENITDWLEHKLNAAEQPQENEMLVYAAIEYFPYGKATSILKKLFKNFPLQVADAFTYIGKQEDLDFLKENNKAHKKQIDKAIKKLASKI